jgi:hypothetical protein
LKGIASQHAIRGQTREGAPEVELYEHVPRVYAREGALKGAASKRAIRGQTRKGTPRANRARVGPWVYAGGSSQEVGDIASPEGRGAEYQHLAEGALDADFVLGEDEQDEDEEEGGEQRASAGVLSPAQYEKHLRVAVASTLKTLDSFYPWPEKREVVTPGGSNICDQEWLVHIGQGIRGVGCAGLDKGDWFRFNDSKAAEGERLLDGSRGDLAVQRFWHRCGPSTSARRLL